MALSKFNSILNLGALALTVLFARGLTAEPRPYHLTYEVHRNGKLAGQAEINMQQQGERWIIRSQGSGTRGLGRLLGVTDTEEAEGSFVDGRFRPDRFSHHSRLAGFSDDWSAQFNWQDDTVAIKVPIKKGLETADRVEILAPPLRTSDRILLTGNYGLPDTARVKIEQ